MHFFPSLFSENGYFSLKKDYIALSFQAANSPVSGCPGPGAQKRNMKYTPGVCS
jgi:hypothetical protein